MLKADPPAGSAFCNIRIRGIIEALVTSSSGVGFNNVCNG